MPYPSTPCKLATPETALWLFQGWVGGLWAFSTPLDTPRCTPMPALRDFRDMQYECRINTYDLSRLLLETNLGQLHPGILDFP
jgi:hypothetical protein